MSTLPVILASSSAYRKQLLEKLRIPFTCQNPGIDEHIGTNETAMDAVIRLSVQKAEAIARNNAMPSLIIASDQIACLGNTLLGKPLTRENAIQQLHLCSGQKVSFLTGLCVYNTLTKTCQKHIEVFNVYFRKLSLAEIAHYIAADDPLHCAGSFKAENLGIALFERMEGEDYNSLIGLPVIRLVSFLKNEGINVLA